MAVTMNESPPVIADGRCRSEGTAGTSGVATTVVLPGVHWGQAAASGCRVIQQPGMVAASAASRSAGRAPVPLTSRASAIGSHWPSRLCSTSANFAAKSGPRGRCRWAAMPCRRGECLRIPSRSSPTCGPARLTESPHRRFESSRGSGPEGITVRQLFASSKSLRLKGWGLRLKGWGLRLRWGTVLKELCDLLSHGR
jgi:hypothetical protein